jgi:imidazolonepropionase-like amidohydrolase
MRSGLLLVIVGLFGAACAGRGVDTAPPSGAHGVEYRGGSWFDGTRFVARTVYVVDGVLHARRPATVDSIIDLTGGYVVPPFADAHHHLVDPRIQPTINAFLRDGIFYVKDQANAPIGRQPIHSLLNRPASFDYISANQGWTSPAGHPVEVIRRGAAMGGPIAAFIRDSLDPGLVNQVESTGDIDRRWPYFVAGKPAPDFVKVYLFYSEDHARRRGDARFNGNRGIDPALVPHLVALAHKAGLQVSAHVYTAADFRAAVASGVDQIAHIPGGRQNDPAPFLLTDADAASAAAKGITVITTIVQHGDSATTDAIVKTQYAHNITVLRRQKVRLALGSDLFGGTARTEAQALARTGLFTNLELLRLWSVETPRAIFPQRRIGEFRDGFEASFLVLDGDPLADFGRTAMIRRRVKQGMPLTIAP